jgi:hypothetical protein
MTCLHVEEPPLSLKGLTSEHHNCVDCGVNTAPGLPPRELAEYLVNLDGKVPMMLTSDSEMFIVHEHIWEKAGMEPWGGCPCVGCLERRIGRRLKPRDFVRDHPFHYPELPRSERLSQRLGYTAA